MFSPSTTLLEGILYKAYYIWTVLLSWLVKWFLIRQVYSHRTDSRAVILKGEMAEALYRALHETAHEQARTAATTCYQEKKALLGTAEYYNLDHLLINQYLDKLEKPIAATA